jgi:1-acyl-sn-glycerol-3-phosphate acyltransferase
MQIPPKFFPFFHLFARFLVRFFAPRFRATGRRHIPHRGPVILAPNHLSDADPTIMVAAMLRRGWYMAKKEIWDDFPLVGKFIERIQAFPVDTSKNDRGALQFALDLLARGEAVVIFPEGHCSRDGELQELEAGAIMLALRAKVPIVPVGIAHSNKIQPYAQLIPRFTLEPVRVHFGPPLDFSHLAELSRREQRVVAAQQLETAIRQAVQVARGEK